MATQENGFNFSHFILGRPLRTQDLPHQTVSKPIGLAVFASDALSSTAYATEEILVMLSLAGVGVAVLNVSIPIAIAIAVLLWIVTLSYRQTIHAYPNGGGAYIVARDNLGEVAAQVAGAALLTDYILTVAVSISSGVAQITSAFAVLQMWKVEIAILFIALITIINLRGVRESGLIFSIPTYFFLAMMFLSLAIGLFRYLTGTLAPVEGVEAISHDVIQPLTLFLILRAFSSGCTALTGIEAISNGIMAFKEPRSKNAATTLMWMSTLLVIMFIGITFLSRQINALPSHHETIISQLARAIHGNGSILYLLTLGSTTAVLVMAANTSYADFPRLASLIARDGFLPRQMALLGGRLVFSTGIVVLAIVASLLVVVTGASVTNLVPLYAIGVFLSFTMSQSGMVVRGWKIGKLKPGEKLKSLETRSEYDPHWLFHTAISALGSLSTFVVVIIFAVTKFTGGAWVIVLLVPALVLIFFRIHKHYQTVRETLSLVKRDINGKPMLDAMGKKIIRSVDVTPRKIKTMILVDSIHAGTVKMVRYAESLGHPWRAVHFAVNPKRAEEELPKWAERIGIGKLEIIDSPYRELTEDIKDEIERMLAEDKSAYVHVIIGQLVTDTLAEQLLHQNSNLIFNLALSRLERVAVTTIPYQIHNVHDHHGEPAPDMLQQ